MGLAETSVEYRQVSGPDRLIWVRVAIYTLAFQIAWFWRQIPGLFREGALPDTDDFQRLTEVRNWLGGQSWFDLTNYRMDPPFGADMHWSRLVDVPIAALIRFFELFVGAELAERITAFVWPSLLLLATVFVLIAICRKLDEQLSPLLVVLYTLTCFTALSAYAPGRFDHHSVQILLFCVLLFGLVDETSKWAPYLVSAMIAASVSVGLDAVLIIVAALAWISLSWAWQRPNSQRIMAATGIGLLVSFPMAMVLNFAPSQWFVARCDTLSIVYFAAFMYIGAVYVLLPPIFARLRFTSTRVALAARLAAGVCAAAAGGAIVFSLFPDCASGPFGSVSPELYSRWLVDVSEARGMFVQLERNPQMWIAVLGYCLFILAVSAYVTYRRMNERPAFLVLFAVLGLSIAASFLQYRALRIGIFVSIPFCVAAVGMNWDYVKSRFGDRRKAMLTVHVTVAMLLLSPLWLLLASALLPDDRQEIRAAAAGAEPGVELPAWQTPQSYIFCNEAGQYAHLAALAPGYVMTDINSGAPALVFTVHDVVGGPYHRNERAILDMLDFFGKPQAQARAIAMRRGIDYVAYCEPLEPVTAATGKVEALSIAIRTGNEPGWLQRLSAPEERLHVFAVRKDAKSGGEN
jgi:hypothetical protein